MVIVMAVHSGGAGGAVAPPKIFNVKFFDKDF